MKLWLRLALVTMTVGGGFAGFLFTMESLFNTPHASAIKVVASILFMGLYAFVTASGLLFVHDPTRNGLVTIALMLQVPCISSPVIVYRFGAGFDLCAAIGGNGNPGGIEAGFFWDFLLGSRWKFALGSESPLRLGVNVVALAFLLLLLAERKSANPAVRSIADSAS